MSFNEAQTEYALIIISIATFFTGWWLYLKDKAQRAKTKYWKDKKLK